MSLSYAGQFVLAVVVVSLLRRADERFTGRSPRIGEWSSVLPRDRPAQAD